MSETRRLPSDILGPEWFPTNEAEREALFRSQIHGTRHSNWALLADTAKSLLGYAAVGTGRVLSTWSRQVDNGVHPAEIDFLVGLNYDRAIIGPVLGAITTSVFALESFTQLATTVLIEAAYDANSERQRALREFETTKDGLRSAARKVSWLAKRADVALSPESKRRIEWLFSFRNDLAHDSPILFTEDGLIRRSLGSDKVHDPSERYGEWMPSLHEGNVPVDISHALEAARLHDAIVLELLSNPVVDELVERHGARPRWQITRLGLVDTDDLEKTSSGWTQDYLPWRDLITSEQREEFYRRMVRKAKIKPVKPSQAS